MALNVIFALFLLLLLLIQLFTGRAFTNSPHWLRVRQSERPGRVDVVGIGVGSPQ